jgi:hypothetical protein
MNNSLPDCAMHVMAPTAHAMCCNDNQVHCFIIGRLQNLVTSVPVSKDEPLFNLLGHSRCRYFLEIPASILG